MVAFETHGVFLVTDDFALHPLIFGVFLRVAQTAIHLSEVLGREDEHQFVLSEPVAVHVEHAAGVFALALVQLGFEAYELLLLCVDVPTECVDLLLYACDDTLLLVDLSVEHLKVGELRFDVFSCGGEL